MDQQTLDVLRDYEQRTNEENQRVQEIGWENFIQHRDEFLLAVGPATGQLLNLLAKELKATTILEVGTSYGYSTVWLADAARTTGGRVITLESVPEKQQYARSQLNRAGLGAHVDFRLGDARQTIPQLAGPVDFVLLDLWKDLYIPCFDLFYEKLSPGALIVADNMVYPASSNERAQSYRQHVRAKPDMQSILLQVGSGLEVSRCVRGGGIPV